MQSRSRHYIPQRNMLIIEPKLSNHYKKSKISEGKYRKLYFSYNTAVCVIADLSACKVDQ